MATENRKHHQRRISYKWNEFDLEELVDRLRELPHLFRLRPVSGRFWLDVFFVLFLVACQFSILPSVLPKYLPLDLLTPWLIFTYVFHRTESSVFLTCIAAFALETHTSSPAGTYFTSYFILLIVIVSVRETLSWQHHLPWNVAIGVGLIWVLLFRFLTAALAMGVFHFTWSIVLSAALGTGLSFVLGRWAAFYYLGQREGISK